MRFNNSNRSFDFYLPDFSLCVELHGKQHYSSDISFGPHSYLNTIRSDAKKRALVKKNNLKLAEINCSSGERLKIIEEINNCLVIFDLPNCKASNLSFLNKQLADIKQMYLSGLSANKIGLLVGVSKTTVLKALRDLGIERRKSAKMIINLNTKIVFKSLKEPHSLWGVSDSNICYCLKKKTQYAGSLLETEEKLKWTYFEEYVNEYGFVGISCYIKNELLQEK